MAETTPIEWTDATWNPIGGCSIKSPGCIRCYAQALAGTRLKAHPLYAGTTDLVKGKPVFNGRLTAAPDDHPVWTWPRRWRGAATPKLGPDKPSMIFVADMSDLFHEDRPLGEIDRVFAVMGLNRRHVFQVLTKRSGRLREYLTDPLAEERVAKASVFIAPLSGGVGRHDSAIQIDATVGWEKWPLPNVWLGVSAERQQEAEERVPDLLATPAAIRFVSYEPARGPLRTDGWLRSKASDPTLDWIIAGGESGRGAEPANPDWFRSVRDRCADSNVPFLFKQWGEWLGSPDELNFNQGAEWAAGLGCGAQSIQQWSSGHTFARVGKKAAGRLLDGREHIAFPEACA